MISNFNAPKSDLVKLFSSIKDEDDPEYMSDYVENIVKITDDISEDFGYELLADLIVNMYSDDLNEVKLKIKNIEFSKLNKDKLLNLI